MIDDKTLANKVSVYEKMVMSQLKDMGIYNVAENELVIRDMARLYKAYLRTQSHAEDAEFEEDFQLAMQLHRTSLSYYKQVQDSLKNLGITLNQRIQRNEAQQAGQDSLAAMKDAMAGKK